MTDDNALMGEPLSDAERLAYAEIYNGAHNTDHSMLGLKPGATCKRCESTARAVVAAVGPFMAIKFYENLADLTEKQGPMSAADFRALALLTRQSLSLPASKETR